MIKAKKSFRNLTIVGTTLLVAVLSGVFYYVNLELKAAIEKAGETANATLTRVFVNETWSEISPLLPPPGSTDQDAIKNPNIKKIDNRIRRFMSYTDVLKVKLYNVKGLTVYSSEAKQIGEDKSSNLGFQQAVKGKLASELTYRGKFGAFDGEMYNRNLVSTYAPIRDGYQVVAVAEIYSDRTVSIQQATDLRNDLLLVLVLSFGAIYSLILYFAFRSYKNFLVRSVNVDSVPESPDQRGARDALNPAVSSPGRLIAGAPLPELSLPGVEKILHRLSLVTDEDGRPDLKLDPRLFLSNLTQTAKEVLARIVRYRFLESPELLKGGVGIKLDFDELISVVSGYTDRFAALSSLKFFQGQKFVSGFTQDPHLIESLITSIVDIVSYSFVEAELEIKFFGEKDSLSIDLIAQNTKGTKEPNSRQVFEVLDTWISTAARVVPFSYKATLSDKGLLVSFIFREKHHSDSPTRGQDYSEALVFGGSTLEARLFSTNLERLGLKTTAVMSSQELGSCVPASSSCLLFVLLGDNDLGFGDMESIVRIANERGVLSENIYSVTSCDLYKSPAIAGIKVLRMPVDFEELRQRFRS